MIILLWWCCYALLNGVSTSCLNVVNTRKVENSLVNFQSNKYINLLLKNISAVFTVAKKFNHLVYNAFHIAENIFIVNGWLTSCLLFVNCLYESQQCCRDFILSRWKIFSMLQWFNSCKNTFTKVNKRTPNSK